MWLAPWCYLHWREESEEMYYYRLPIQRDTDWQVKSWKRNEKRKDEPGYLPKDFSAVPMKRAGGGSEFPTAEGIRTGCMM